MKLFDRFSKKCSNVMKIHPVRAGLFLADGRTDMTKLIGAFRNFAKAPKMIPRYDIFC
jgi:hypothetical protein